MSRAMRILYGIVALVIMLACAPLTVPSTVAAPSFDPNSINTVIALTAGSAATQTALLSTATFTPTVTFLPTNTLQITETSTPTFIFILATSTVPSSTPEDVRSDLDYDCRVNSQTPANNSGMNAGADFEARWQIKNIGQKDWSSENTDYHYTNGDKLYKVAAYDLKSSVPTEGSTDVVVAMKAPSKSGTYSTTWKLKSGKTEFCTMKLTIVVH
jgi:Ig-like domain from next to BRCA1 gene